MTEDVVVADAPDEGDTQAAVLEAAAVPSTFFARFGSFLLRVRPGLGKHEVYAAVRAGLEADNRVARQKETQFQPDWSHWYWFFPPKVAADASSLLGGTDAFPVLYFVAPLVFQVVVPVKNQPLFRHEEDVPTDTYWVAWDGVTAVVLWERGESEGTPPKSAGHVVADVLVTAARTAGLEVVEQACSPGCTNKFAHHELLVTRRDGAGSAAFEDARDRVVPTEVLAEADPFAVVTALSEALTKSGRLFAQFKNGARRLIDMENLARKFVGKLLRYDYLRIGPPSEGWWASRWRGLRSAVVRREDGYTAKQLLAILWLTMSNIETLKRDAFRALDRFQDAAAKAAASSCYAIDLRDDIATAEAIDTQFVRAAVEQKSNRLDTRWVIIATFAGAAAAVVAAFVGLSVGQGS